MYYEIVYDMLVNVNVIYYVHVCEQARGARSVGNSAIENLCIIIIIYFLTALILAIVVSRVGQQNNIAHLFIVTSDLSRSP